MPVLGGPWGAETVYGHQKQEVNGFGVLHFQNGVHVFYGGIIVLIAEEVVRHSGRFKPLSTSCIYKMWYALFINTLELMSICMNLPKIRGMNHWKS